MSPFRRPGQWGKQARAWAWEKDRGVCVLCGFDAPATWRTMRDPKFADERLDQRTLARCRDGGLLAFVSFGTPLAALIAKGFIYGESLWQADHIVRLTDGGKHAPENIRTLCVPCHKTETARASTDKAEFWREKGRCVYCAKVRGLLVTETTPDGPRTRCVRCAVRIDRLERKAAKRRSAVLA